MCVTVYCVCVVYVYISNIFINYNYEGVYILIFATGN